jgi:SNF2 family DNA or RNA helicase
MTIVETESNLYHFRPPDDFVLDPWQQKGIDFLVPRKKAILADQMGIGKTIQVLKAHAIWQPPRTLISGSKNSTYTWMKELQKYYPNLAKTAVFIRGTPAQRKRAWNNFDQGIAIVTYGVMKSDVDVITAMKWDAMYCDEAQKMKNKKTQTYKAAKQIVLKARPPIVVPVTGSPAKRGPQDTWTLFNLVKPDMFPSYWQYINHFCVIDNNGFGQEIIGVQNMEEFRRVTGEVLIRRLKMEVNPNMPKKRRSIVPIEMTGQQAKLYRKMCEDMIAEVDSGYMVASTVLTSILRLRQLLTCPKLWGPEFDVGGAIEAMMEHMDDEELDKAVMFTSFPAAFPFFRDYIESKGFVVLQLRGGMEPEEIGKVIDTFEKPGKLVVMLSIPFAESFDLVPAQAGYFIGPDYDPEANYQAEDRIHRRTLKHDVDMFYFQHQKTTEMELFDILNEKVRNTKPMFHSPQALKEILLATK